MTLIGKTLAAIGAMAVPLTITVVGAAPATADPNLCVSGPYGFAYACVDTPGWVDWHDGPRGRGHWKHGHGWDD
ncbi:hypothetical protein [Mycobacterium hubeiense]|uniref:hypothetical protein n=1 Tax=Mycobacterium hubeiense TaxID=1867256 RepID=UPI000C7EFF9B|nr:hypothetical protein [Mycobacterium sp. QGD 101]